MKKGVLYEPTDEERRSVHKELLIAQYKEVLVTDAEFAELLKPAGLD